MKKRQIDQLEKTVKQLSEYGYGEEYITDPEGNMIAESDEGKLKPVIEAISALPELLQEIKELKEEEELQNQFVDLHHKETVDVHKMLGGGLVLKDKRSLAREILRLRDVKMAADELLNDVAMKYGITFSEDNNEPFQCPLFNKIYQAIKESKKNG